VSRKLKQPSPRLNTVSLGDGPAFVFQHGLCADAAQTTEVFPADAGFRLLTVECRGHGRSEAAGPQSFSLACFADDVAATIEDLAIAPAVVGGISMGAAIALRLAVHRPELVRALVLARPAWIAEPSPPNMRPYAEVGELLARHPPGAARARFEASDTAARLRERAPDNFISLIGFLSRRPRRVTAELLTRISADGPGVSRDQLAALRLPALIIGHGKDEAHPLAYAEKLADLIPDSRLVKITPKADSRQRYVADFREALKRFLADLPETRAAPRTTP